MASITVPCPKLALPIYGVASNTHQKQRITFPRSSNANSLSFGFTFSAFESPERKQYAGGKIRAQLNEVSADTSSNSVPVVNNSSKGKDKSTERNVPDASAISAFMTQVSDLVKLVDSRDIVELELKQLDCELIIRKKEALQQPASAAPVITMPTPYPQGVFPPPSPPPPAPAVAPAPAASPPAPAAASPAPAKAATSSHPPLKCPMAGTFYRAPGPGEPPFVKVGDKVQKGQVVCLIEAMKLMNEIEADQSGTIAEILAEDGKPVSVDQPLFVIAP